MRSSHPSCLKKNFSAVLDSDEEWSKVCRALVRMRDQPASLSALQTVAQSAATRPAAAPAVQSRAWYLGRWCVSFYYLILAFVVLYFVTPLLETGRDRFWGVIVSLGLGGAGVLWVKRGPDFLSLPSLPE